MTTTTPVLRQVSEQPHVEIPLSDGCVLSARIWMPVDADDQPVPASLEQLPYRKRDGTVHRDELTHPWMAARGYACVRTDMRGSGESEGIMTDEYTPQELQDACEVIAWLCAQRWCTGSIGMMGISWGGFNSLQVASLRPPGLKAIITLCSTVDRYADDIHYKGGCLLNENAGWAANMLSYSSPPPDPLLVGDTWKDMWMQRLQNQPFLASTWLREQSRSDYWKHGSVCEDYDAIDAAVLSIGGWHDGYRNTIAHLVRNLNAPVRGIVGPWIHKYPHYAAPQPAIGFLQLAHDWWNQWLKGQPASTGNTPAYSAWLMDSVQPKRWLDERPGRWIAEQSLPSPHIHTTTLYCSLSADAQKGRLSEAPASLQTEICTSQICGAATGEYFPFTFGPELPDDQRGDDKLSVCFDGDLLDRALDIVGAPGVKLTFSSDKPLAFVVCRLCDLRPDGTSALITYGIMNLTHHQSSAQPQRLQAGKQYAATITMDEIAYRIGEGHRLRLSFSTSYWPLLWPSPEAATLTLTSAGLNLPLRPPANGDEVSFEAPETAEGWQTKTQRQASSTRNTVTDPNTGIVTTIIDNDFGEHIDLQHSLVSGSKVVEKWSIHPEDPLTARADIHWIQSGGRDQWHWQTSATCSMRSDEKYFYLSASLSVHNDDALFFERQYEDKIERKWV